MAAGSYVHMRASTADQDRSIEVLKASFVEGRLTKDELDLRLGPRPGEAAADGEGDECGACGEAHDVLQRNPRRDNKLASAAPL